MTSVLDGSPAAHTEHAQGCLLCGTGLEYFLEASPMSCATCGEMRASTARCLAGHFVCDACHAGPAKDVIERVCSASESTDPVSLATALMRHPGVKLHGPEHHFLVPAVLVSAWANATGKASEKPLLLAEARRRSDSVVGGSCGFHGACGAGIGTGIFASLTTSATPLARGSWGLANGATAAALGSIAALGGPRCCKRTGWLAILTGVRFSRQHLGVRLRVTSPRCEFHGRNADCLAASCPFYPKARQLTEN
jgi:predicted RNA-binding Zn-ribbon protein involved in translation (DUF1610 family)